MIETMKLATWHRRSPLAVCALLLAAVALPAQETSLNFEPTQTKVEFTLGDVLHTVHGTFALKRGNIRFDVVTGRADGELVVDATSGNSGSGARDRRMNKDILESAKFPEIVFRPNRVEGFVAPQGPSRVQLHGTFTIHGSEHEMAVPVDVQAEGGQYIATATFAVPYVKWGMKNPSTLFFRVNDHVEITVQAKMPAQLVEKSSQ